MVFIRNFFKNRGFDFDENFESKDISIEDKKFNLKFYKNLNPTKTSFYILNQEVSELDLIEVKKSIWNENQADLLFTIQKKNSSSLFDTDNYTVNLHYTKLSPKSINSKIDSFSGDENEIDKLERINKWQFDSGTFWLNYTHFLDKIKNAKKIDKELIATLKRLKDNLTSNIQETDKIELEKKVQALIDRTLYIKYLEDNHIINSYFYNFYFNESDLTYKVFLKNKNPDKLNQLFSIIHKIFNNSLFDQPIIEKKYLTDTVCNLIHDSISGTNLATGQLSLFDFRFDIIPLEFISYIYEVFLTEKQKENGIYYTPKKLAQLIVDDVIPKNKIGRILDPSCGSGMFLIVAFQKLLENSPESKNADISEKIKHRIKLLSENIFGIEKETIAQRFTLFSLSLQVFRGLEPEKIKEYITNQLKEHGEVRLFEDCSFFKNIICQNSLEVNLNNLPFNNQTFDYIIGNPPFFEIKNEDDEFTFISKYKTVIDGKEIIAKGIIGKHQISQCFFLKIKDWSNNNTRFGFVSNNSSFYNDNSKNFQKFFYQNYKIEKIYELSKVKNILFEKAEETVNTLIFNNQSNASNRIEFYSVEMGFFSEKPFELLIIQEDKVIHLEQDDLINGNTRLRDFLIGNDFDRKLIEKLNSNLLLDEYLLKDIKGKSFVHRGLEIWGEDARKKEFDLDELDWKKYDADKKNGILDIFINKYFNNRKSPVYKTGYVKPRDLTPFKILPNHRYVSDISNFHRTREDEIFSGDKIILSRLGNSLNATYSNKKIYFDFSIYVFKLSDVKLYYLITAILNSQLSNYYVNSFLRKRIYGSFPRIGVDDIKQIPIPKNLDDDLVARISQISKDLTEGENNYEKGINETMNDLIFDLYNLSYLEKQRIKDYFKQKDNVNESDLNLYKQALLDTIEVYFKNPIEIETFCNDFDLVIAKVYLNVMDNNPSAEKVAQFTLNEIFKQNSNSYLVTQEKIFGKNCIYIIKKNCNNNWTETKAFEDGQEILKRITNG